MTFAQTEYYLIKKMQETGTTGRQPGSGRPRTSRTAENIDTVNDLVLRQEDAPGTHITNRHIARETGFSWMSVGCITKTFSYLSVRRKVTRRS